MSQRKDEEKILIQLNPLNVKCEMCLKNFNSNNNRDLHSRLHMGSSGSVCVFCGWHISDTRLRHNFIQGQITMDELENLFHNIYEITFDGQKFNFKEKP